MQVYISETLQGRQREDFLSSTSSRTTSQGSFPTQRGGEKSLFLKKSGFVIFDKEFLQVLYVSLCIIKGADECQDNKITQCGLRNSV